MEMTIYSQGYKYSVLEIAGDTPQVDVSEADQGEINACLTLSSSPILLCKIFALVRPQNIVSTYFFQEK